MSNLSRIFLYVEQLWSQFRNFNQLDNLIMQSDSFFSISYLSNLDKSLTAVYCGRGCSYPLSEHQLWRPIFKSKLLLRHQKKRTYKHQGFRSFKWRLVCTDYRIFTQMYYTYICRPKSNNSKALTEALKAKLIWDFLEKLIRQYNSPSIQASYVMF